MKSYQIPLKIEEIEQVLDTEFLVDFNNICFDGIPEEKQIETAFLYFRNTGFNFKPDFSKCSIEKIADILETYICTEYDVQNNWLQTIWLQLVLEQIGAEIIECNILSEDQISQLGKLLKNLVTELASFIISLPVYSLSLIKSNYANDGSINRTNFSEFGINLYNILQNDLLEEILVHLQLNNQMLLPKFYNIYFQKNNTQLNDIVKNIKQFSLLLTLVDLTLVDF